jgi:putative nucleotidyltransferase with HDIG domain
MSDSMPTADDILPLETEPVMLDDVVDDVADDVAEPETPSLDLLSRAFGVEFNILDGTSGEGLHTAAEQPVGNWNGRTELCRQVARAGRAEFIADEDPLLVLALPLCRSDEACPVAVATFVTRPVPLDEDLSQAARLLGLDCRDIVYWANRQTAWAPEMLRRMADMVVSQVSASARIDELVEQTQGLSSHLAATYEEISLLYRLTQNLKISKGDEQLGQLALEWLGEVVPAEGFALYLTPLTEKPLTEKTDEKTDVHTHGPRTEAVLLTSGRCPIDVRQFGRLIDHVGLDRSSHPLVANRGRTAQGAWPCSEVRQMVAVPLTEGDNLFGYLAAINHVDDAEFGTVEASLLGSVGAILGIHGGNIELYRQQSEMFAGIVRALASAIDAKDPYTSGHSDRVARIAVRLASELGCDTKSLGTIYLAGLLHDIGKIGIEDVVLRKPGKLTDAEYEHIKSHAEIGHRILVDLQRMDDVLPVVLHHHEAWDGGGYPHHLPSDQIPFHARIVAVADAFDAMSSDRPYRKGMPGEKIDGIFRAGAAKQWDPSVVDAFFRARRDIHEIVDRRQDDFHADLAKWT